MNSAITDFNDQYLLHRAGLADNGSYHHCPCRTSQKMCSAMNHSPPAHPNHRLSPRSMICPLIKLGRSSPPTADQKYDIELDTLGNNGRAYSPADYSLLQSSASHDEHSYREEQSHSQAYRPNYNQKQVYVSIANYPGEPPPNFKLPDYQVTQQQDTYHPYFVMSEQTSYRNTCKQKHGVYEKNACGNAKIKSCNLEYEDDTEYQANKNITGLSSLSINNERFWSEIQNKPELCNEAIQCRHDDFQRYYKQKKMSPLHLGNYVSDNYNLGKSSPSLDQGYHTLLSPSPGSSNVNIERWTDSGNMYKGKKTISKNNPFDRLSDDLIVKIFSYLYSYDLSVCARICRRFENLAWRPCLWKTLTLCGDNVGGDKAIRSVLRQLCSQGQNHVCNSIERVYLSDGAKIADRELTFLARRCPELTHLQIHGCNLITNPAIYELVTRCINLQHLDITGCTNVSCITIMPEPEPPLRLLLQYLDLTDCPAIEDNSLRIIVRNCPQLVYLYLRRCIQITDTGLKYVPSFCSGLKEFSVSDCSKVTDFGLYELAKLGATLRYLSVAKCDQVSDAGLKVIARRCYKLRYLNARGCEAVSDDAITVLARSCTRLRALDIGKCDVSDAGLRALAESCPNIKKLSLRNCDLVTDRGIQCIAYYCRGLQQLNIQDCQISIEGYRAVKQYCRRCVIEHTNPGFF